MNPQPPITKHKSQPLNNNFSSVSSHTSISNLCRNHKQFLPIRTGFIVTQIRLVQSSYILLLLRQSIFRLSHSRYVKKKLTTRYFCQHVVVRFTQCKSLIYRSLFLCNPAILILINSIKLVLDSRSYTTNQYKNLNLST